ncbi:cartilage intermediate layer protein 2-like [Melanotaenia boesemani]|uniref:cartilage intermediate layer protein 2-like n=1 Tax=Melanotaenia boesemani TaxID=1250792 RepID=UPI001C0599A5|nr:cartilage intermediate layer protein 2-like [Melanotaenia boesemani]
MIKLLSLAIVVGLFSGSVRADDIDARPIAPERNEGLTCYHSSPVYCWTEWFDSDNPSRQGDKESFSRLRRKYPGKICREPIDMEAKTLSGKIPEEAGDIIEINDKRTEFICKKKDQPDRKCEDYKVRFSCPLPYCAEFVCWTEWYDQSKPSRLGDWETLSRIHEKYPGEVCKYPLYMEVVDADTMKPAINTGDRFYMYNPMQGFVCRNIDQKRGNCKNYKVRFGCPCDN